ncbi:MAG: dihydroorotate dehydrogenase-like protein [Kiritimatiellae bacterium]|nr:dihydroorotate dehydrogenase-like protein [Kiritimatiellia bacterium]
MEKLAVTYLGLRLKNPLVASSGPLTSEPGSVLALEDAGVGAVVLRSIFEEQIKSDGSGAYRDLEGSSSNFAFEYLRADLPMQLMAEKYLDRIVDIKARVGIPVIASCNCIEKAQWVAFAKKIEQAGADALELNLYHMPVNVNESADLVEKRRLDAIKAVRETVKIPVAVKLSHHYTSLLSFARQLDLVPVNGIVLFNRFLQTDVNIETEATYYKTDFTTSNVLHSQLRWTAIVRDFIRADIALSGGIHSGEDLVKALLVGANVGYAYSCLAKSTDQKKTVASILDGLTAWMDRKGYADISAFRGKLRETNLKDGKGFERMQYVTAAMNVQ